MRDLMSDEFFTVDAMELDRGPNGRFAYIREITQDEASIFTSLDPEAILPSGVKLYAVRADDGKTLGITDSWAAAYWTALSHDFSPLSVH